MSKAFTARYVESIKPNGKRQWLPDAYLPGFYLVVQPEGAKSWAIRYRYRRRPRNMKLADYPAIDLKGGRELAREAFRAVAEGRDPASERLEARRQQVENTVAAVVEKFLELHCRPNNKARTVESTETILTLYVLPRWSRRGIVEIERRDVLDLLDGLIAAGKPVAANRVLTVVRTLFNWALARGIITTSPVAGMKSPTSETPRDRVLSDDELHAVWTAAGKLGGPYGALIKILLLTGQRRDEVARLPWSELDLETAVWTIPAARAKNSRAHDVPLSEPVLAILNELPRRGDYVLTTDGKVPSSNYGANKRRLDAVLPPDMPHWTLHDLRRTAASGMARLGVSLPTVERLLNHISGSFGGIVSVYQKHDFAPEKRRAVDLWGAHILGLGQESKRGRRAADVVRLQARA